MKKKFDSNIGIALSGGGSRAIAYHYGVFEKLHELKIDKKISVISAVSGGAVFAAIWVLYSNHWKDFSDKIEKVLSSGLEHSIKFKLLNPIRFIQQICRLGLNTDILSSILDETIFNNILLSNIPKKPLLIINSSDLNSGCNFKFSRDLCGSYKSGGFETKKIRLSEAVACSASYPVFFSPKKFTCFGPSPALLTDGGVYDALGANSLMPDKVNEISILTQKCKNLIFSDASMPYPENKYNYSSNIFNTLHASYLTALDRNRSLIYNKMFELHRAEEIPYIGVIKMDSKYEEFCRKIKSNELDLIRSYPTDFKAMNPKISGILRKRGRTVSEIVIKKYLPHLITEC